MAAKSGGCFHGNASVMLETGTQKYIGDLLPGERVLALSNENMVFSEVLTFLDREPTAHRLFFTLRTQAGPQILLTAAHLDFVSEGNCLEGAESAPGTLKTVYASAARPGQCMLLSGCKTGRLSRIVQVSVTTRTGLFSPMTQQGTIMVDGVAASCYAVVDQHHLAHWAFAPLRLMFSWTGSTWGQGDGVHWYPRILHWLGRKLLDAGHLHPLGVGQVVKEGGAQT